MPACVHVHVHACVCVCVRSFVLKVSPISHSAMPCGLFWSMHPACVGPSSLTHLLELCSMLAHTPVNNQSRFTVGKGHCCFAMVSVSCISSSQVTAVLMQQRFSSAVQIHTSLWMVQWFSELETTAMLSKRNKASEVFLRFSNNRMNHIPKPYPTCEFTVLSRSSDSLCLSARFASVCFPVTVRERVCAPIYDGACVTSVECEQRVERFLSRLRGIAVCCVHQNRF